jgi:hypothetical protein
MSALRRRSTKGSDDIARMPTVSEHLANLYRMQLEAKRLLGDAMAAGEKGQTKECRSTLAGIEKLIREAGGEV